MELLEKLFVELSIFNKEKVLDYFNEDTADIITASIDLPEDFIIENLDKLDVKQIIINQKISSELIEEFMNEDTADALTVYQDLNMELIDKYNEILDLDTILAFQKVNDEFIEKYADRLNWEMVCTYYPLSVDMIKKYQNKIHWDILAEECPLSKEHLMEFGDNLDIKNLSKNRHLDEDFLKEHKFKMNWSSYLDSGFKKPTEDFLNNFGNIMAWELNYSFKNLELPEWYMGEYVDFIDWKYAIKYQPLSPQFIKKYYDKMNIYPEDLVKYQALTPDLIVNFYLPVKDVYIIAMVRDEITGGNLKIFSDNPKEIQVGNYKGSREYVIRMIEKKYFRNPEIIEKYKEMINECYKKAKENIKKYGIIQKKILAKIK